MKRIFLFLLFLSLYNITRAQEFRHPGLLVTQESLSRMKGYIEQGNPTVAAAYEALCKDGRSQADYKMRGPWHIVARDGKHGRTKGGSESDMTAAFYNALRYRLTGETPHANRAMAIINAYADSLLALDGHDAPLCCLQGFYLVNAMELMREQATPTEMTQWKAMLKRSFVATMDRFEADSPYANGNWGAIVNKMRMAVAIFTDDREGYSKACGMFLQCNDNSALPNYIAPTGQCQETGRDQAHAQLGVGNLAEQCEMAWNQGDDLWGTLDNRMLTGYEYMAKYNLGYDDVPFTTWTDRTGLYCNWTVPSAMQRGKLRPVYELAYAHYVGRRGLSMPYTAMALGRAGSARPEDKTGNCDAMSPASLLFYNGAAVDMKHKPLEVKSLEKQHHVWVYPAPEGAPMKADYLVEVKPNGSNEWTVVPTYMAKVNAPVLPSAANGQQKNAATEGVAHRVSEISYAMFDFDGGVSVRVTCLKRKYKTARVRPDYRGVIANVANDSVLNFGLFQPENVSVEFDGDWTDNLLLFTSRPVQSREEAQREAKRQGRRFVYVAPGYYPAGRLDAVQRLMPAAGKLKENAVDVTESSAPVAKALVRVPANTTVYLAPGAYVEGTLAVEDVHDVAILGRGICRPTDGYEGAHVHRSQNVTIDGLVLNTCPIGESRNITLHDVRSISHPGWGDGLNVFGGSSDILFDRVFCRNSDDCTTVYATRKGFHGSARRVTMRNSTLWADVAHPIFIGIHGDAQRGDTISDLRYENIDILCQAEPQLDYQGCLAINCGDNNLVQNVTFDNIRIEGILQGSICQFKVGYNQKYCAAPGRGIDGVTLHNVRYNGPKPDMALILGYTPERTVQNVRFEGLRINGKAIHDAMPGKPAWYKTADMMNLYHNDLVRNLTFTK